MGAYVAQGTKRVELIGPMGIVGPGEIKGVCIRPIGQRKSL